MSEEGIVQRGASTGLERGPMAAYLNHHQVSALSSFQRIVRLPVSSLMTVLVLAIALALPAGLYVMLENVKRVTSGFETGTQISVYLNTRVSDEQARKQAGVYRLRPELAEVRLIDRDAALAEFEAVSGWGDVLAFLDHNPLPAVLVLTPTAAHSSPEALQQLAASLSQDIDVESVQIDMQWVKRLYSLYALAGRAVLALAILLGLAMLLIVGNTIRLAIENRRDEIVVVKLVGGTDAYVRRPFLYTGFWYGLFSALFSWLMVSLTLAWLDQPVNQLAELYFSRFHLSGLAWEDGILLLALGAFVGVGGAWLAVKRHLDDIEPA